MKTTTQAALFFAAAVGAMSLGVAFTGTADAMPIPLHHPTVALTPGVCDSAGPDMWTTTLTVTADVAGGTAHILDAASGWQVPVPVSHVYHVGTNYPTWPVTVSVSWPDGFVSDAVTLVAHRPPSGCVPTTVPGGTTTTTTCSRAIPPRMDCQTTTVPATTTPAPTSTVPDAPTTTPTTAGTSVAVKRLTPSPPSSSGVSGTLPTTGPSDDLKRGGLIGLAAVLVGLVILVLTRQRAKS